MTRNGFAFMSLYILYYMYSFTFLYRPYFLMVSVLVDLLRQVSRKHKCISGQFTVLSKSSRQSMYSVLESLKWLEGTLALALGSPYGHQYSSQLYLWDADCSDAKGPECAQDVY